MCAMAVALSFSSPPYLPHPRKVVLTPLLAALLIVISSTGVTVSQGDQMLNLFDMQLGKE